MVFKAMDKRTKQVVAIKNVLQDPKYANREFKIVDKLHHPNCINVHHHFFNVRDNNVYLNIVMDYFPGNLYKVLKFYYK